MTRPNEPAPMRSLGAPYAVLQPARARLTDALSAVGGLTDVREAWEALATAGLIPDDAIDNAQRSFTAGERPPCPECRALSADLFSLERWCDGCGTTRHASLKHPVSVNDALALAADWSAVLAAEEIALVYQREVCKYVPGGFCWLRETEARVAQLRVQFSNNGYGVSDRANTLLTSVLDTGFMLDKIRNRGLLLLFRPL